MEETMQSESSPVQAPKKSNGMLIVVIVLVLALAGVGYWGFTQSSALKATQADLATMTQKFDTLTAENTQLTTDFDATKAELDTTKSDLEKTQGDLTTTQGDLKKAQDDGNTKQNKITKASKLAEILYAFSSVKTPTDILAVDSMIKATNDKELQAEWSKFINAPTTQSSSDFLLYMMNAISAALK
jgi:septal ring factor EnvC (AmiA/AmiB activator)